MLKNFYFILSYTYDCQKFLIQSSIKPIRTFAVFSEILTFRELYTLSLRLSDMRPYRPPPIIPYPGCKVQSRQKDGGQGTALVRSTHSEKPVLPAQLARRVRQGPPRDPKWSQRWHSSSLTDKLAYSYMLK